MARLSNGFLGNASGKLGNVVFARWRDIFTARMYQPDISDPKTPAQLNQRGRMMALLQFLSPLNKTFIRHFNYYECPRSTPWAKAIKDNMPAVTNECCITLDKFSLGVPKYPQVENPSFSYDPFIDQVSMEYSFLSHPAAQKKYALLLSSALGKYHRRKDVHEFDVRHLCRNFPPGMFFSDIHNIQTSDEFLSYWKNAWFWFTFFDNDKPDQLFNPNTFLTMPLSFSPAPIIEGFNTEFSENVVPVEAIHWEFRNSGEHWAFHMNIKEEYYDPEIFQNYTMIFWILGLYDNNHFLSPPIEWSLAENQISLDFESGLVSGSAILMYAIFSAEGQQLSRFNRMYIDEDFSGNKIPYYPQLFQCNYAHPASFILPQAQCGFCGNYDELFEDFITFWNQSERPQVEEKTGSTFLHDNIDFSLFKCEILTPDGDFIKNAENNTFKMFYCDGLIPGQSYSIVFSYDGMFLECLLFNCPDSGKVVYLSPAHIIFNKSCKRPPGSFIEAVKFQVKKAEDNKIPSMGWADKTLTNYLDTNPPDKASLQCPKKPKRFKGGVSLKV
jgi:hypothetical protein